MKITAKELAEKMNGRQYGNETTEEIEKQAKENGLVIVFAYSDDNCEFRGAIDEEIPCWNGEFIYFNKDGSNFTKEDGETFLTLHKDKEAHENNEIEAVWCEKEKVYLGDDYFSWTYKTEIPHETFNIFEDETPFCRGIVFSLSDCH